MSSATPRHFRALFLSDFHIGAKAFDASALLSFLRSHESDTLYLVGDIVDGWKLNKRWFWSEEISQVIDELVRKSAAGTKIIYVPGNHDELVRNLSFMRRWRFARRMGLTIRNKIIHETADQRRFLILHGDQFERAVFAGSVSKVSDYLYDKMLDLFNAHGPMTVMVEGKEKRFSMAKFLATQGQRALNALNDFEKRVQREAIDEKVDGIICGHTHVPALKNIGSVLYGNCGSWLRAGHTALAETIDGTLELIDWPRENHDPAAQAVFDFYAEDYPAYYGAIETATMYRPVTDYLVDAIRRVFTDPPKSAAQKLKEKIYSYEELRAIAHTLSFAVRRKVGL